MKSIEINILNIFWYLVESVAVALEFLEDRFIHRRIREKKVYYLSLFDAGGNEVCYDGYERQEVEFEFIDFSKNEMTVANSQIIEFPQITDEDGIVITNVAVMEDPSKLDVLHSGALAIKSYKVELGGTVIIEKGSISIQVKLHPSHD